MRRVILAVSAVSGIFAGVLSGGIQNASAADLRGTRAAPVFNWTGFYVGADAGYLWSKADISTLSVPAAGTASPKPDGLTLGGHLGYRYQFPNRFVVGIEGDISWLDADGTGAFSGVPAAGIYAQGKWDASARGILGFAFDRSLIYATGGASWLKADGCAVLVATPTSCVGGTVFSKTYTGWTIGGGFAYAFNKNLIGRIEYLHADYGSNDFNIPTLATGITQVKITTDKVRAGLSWKF